MSAVSADLAEDEERWRLALEVAGEGVWDWNLHSGQIYRSPLWGEMLGYSSEDSTGLKWGELLHPDDREEAHHRLSACLSGASPDFAAEFRLLCKNGEYRWVASRGRVVARDASGRPGRMVGVYRDIHEAHSLMDALQASERLWQFALEGHGDALWDWTLESGVINVSQTFRAIIGLPADRPLRGNDIWPARLHPDDVRGAVAAFSAHLVGVRSITEVEFRLRTEEGAYRWVALRGKIMERDRNSKPLRMIGTVRDVHDHYLSVEREMRQQQELARAARLIHVGEMASALAHELNQPLTALRNFSAVALRRLDELGASGDGIREPLQLIAEQALRAGEIVHRVRGFVRRDSLLTAPITINDVINDVVRFMEFEARAHAVQWQLALAEPSLQVQGDQLQLEQVLSNLAKNAIDAMSEIEGERLLQVATRLGPDGMVEMAVSDSGGGLADTVRDDPFAPFVTTKPDGVGLGLAICRTIIENHGGRMWVEKSTRRGTTFCLSLPQPAG
ncbi:PAS domain-containing protein [Zoogloea sp. LCSB751]|uniref:PAS domain-containing sensor histidine kinase n=1 Tax=Zoogloea sp. LCSB751 TaxID=1965277 RepID=UPI0009A4CEFC|nr:PAS domain-containing protein [Zoogloea sp. LCSB751]